MPDPSWLTQIPGYKQLRFPEKVNRKLDGRDDFWVRVLDSLNDRIAALEGGGGGGGSTIFPNGFSSVGGGVTLAHGTMYLVDNSGGPVTVDLPASDSDEANNIIGIRVSNPGGAPVTIDPDGSETIDGNATTTTLYYLMFMDVGDGTWQTVMSEEFNFGG